MPSILTSDNHKISLRSNNIDKNTLLTIVKPNGEALSLDLTFSELTAISVMIDSIVLQKEINEEIL